MQSIARFAMQAYTVLTLQGKKIFYFASRSKSAYAAAAARCMHSRKSEVWSAAPGTAFFAFPLLLPPFNFRSIVHCGHTKYDSVGQRPALSKYMQLLSLVHAIRPGCTPRRRRWLW